LWSRSRCSYTGAGTLECVFGCWKIVNVVCGRLQIYEMV
jgi:hypothetical protein